MSCCCGLLHGMWQIFVDLTVVSKLTTKFLMPSECGIKPAKVCLVAKKRCPHSPATRDLEAFEDQNCLQIGMSDKDPGPGKNAGFVGLFFTCHKKSSDWLCTTFCSSPPPLVGSIRNRDHKDDKVR